MKKLIVVAGFIGILAAAFIVIQRAKPYPLPTPAPTPAPAPELVDPTITWSVPVFTSTLFPGTSSTTTITFRSDQNLAGIVIETTGSLSGIVSVSPTSFTSIAANQNYQLTLTLTAPTSFQKRTFGGTIHIRNLDGPPKTYATPLEVSVGTDFQSYTNSVIGISFNYPSAWTYQNLVYAPYFTAPPDVDVLDVVTTTTSGTLQQMALADITRNNCPIVPDYQSIGQYDHVISSSSAGVLYVLWCSEGSEQYSYIFFNTAGQVVRLVYHDDFAFDASEAQKIAAFEQIISSLSIH